MHFDDVRISILIFILLELYVNKGNTEFVDFEKKSGCLYHFYRHLPPRNFPDNRNMKPICQTLDNEFEDNSFYATMFNTKLKIPIFSAYKLLDGTRDDKHRKTIESWFIEPQLEDIRYGKSMKAFQDTRLVRLDNQASRLDYKNSGFDMAQLNPSFYQYGQGKTSTYTLTNVVPVSPYLNRVDLFELEKDTKSIILNKCFGVDHREDGENVEISPEYMNRRAYLISGVIPSGEYLNRTDKRVNIPKAVYTTVCCHDQSQSGGGSFSFAYYLTNSQNFKIDVITADQLGKKVQEEWYPDPLKKPIRFFLGGCGLNEDVLKELKEKISKRKSKRRYQLKD